MSNNQQSQGIRGLSIFIGDIRGCQTKDQEIKVVHKEMAKIRQKFQNKGLSGYDKKKYVWKLIYAHILGYEVEFGHEEALNLINAQKFTEKSSGYIAIGIMLNEKSNFALFERVLNAVKADLNCGNEVCEGLALATLGNIGFAELVPELADIVVAKTFNPNTNSYVRKRAIICLLSFFRRNRSIYNQEQWAYGFKFLLNQKHKGILMSTCSLLSGVITIMGREGLYDLVPLIINCLHSIDSNSEDYYYYKTPCPWLQVKLLKILQLYPPPRNKGDLNQINEIMMKIMNRTEVTKNVNKNNSDHSILFEVFNLIIHYGDASYEILREDTIKLLGQYIDVREPNIRYLALETMSRMSNIDRKSKLIRKFVKVFFKNLRDKDISIRKIALNSLFSLCDAQMSGEVVNEILDYLQENDYELKEEIVLKVAILAEKFAENLNWYIDVIIKLIEYAGDYVNEDLWFRVAQIITGFGSSEPNNQLQRYAALKLYDVIKVKSLHETIVKIGAFVLSEFGNLIAEQDGKSYEDQFSLLETHFTVVSNQTKAMLMTTFMKMVKNHPPLESKVVTVISQYRDHWDEELQQRACEYLQMLEMSKTNATIAQMVGNSLDRMPNFSEELQNNNVLTRRILELKVKKGFAINAEEAEKNMKNNMKQYTTNVSSALTANQVSDNQLAGMDLDGSKRSQFKTGQPQQSNQNQERQQPPQAQESNLLDLMGGDDGQIQEKKEPLDTMAELTEALGYSNNDSTAQNSVYGSNTQQQNDTYNGDMGGGGGLAGLDGMGMDYGQSASAAVPKEVYHQFKDQYPDTFSPTQTVVVEPTDALSRDVSNMDDWKKLQPANQTQGTLYQDDYINIQCQIQQVKYLQRLLLTFNSNSGAAPENIELSLSNYDDSKLTIQCSPVRYQSGQAPQAIVMAMMGQAFDELPILNVMLEIPSQGYSGDKVVRLPVYLNRNIDKVEMPQNVFVNNWRGITLNQPDTFQKVDMVLKNPAPSHIPPGQVLKQIDNFLSNAMNMKVYTSDTLLQAVGQVQTKPQSQDKFPSNPNEMDPSENVPLMIEAQFYPDIDTSEFRLSLRASNSKMVAQQVLNFIKFYMRV